MITKRLLAICGSTRKSSVNHYLIQAIGRMLNGQIQLSVFSEIDQLPHFNPDFDTAEDVPDHVKKFRLQLRESDGVIICTPEYAMGLPGSLKNALDWTVSSCDFSSKPVAIFVASSLGEKAMSSLTDTMTILEARISETSSLLIPFASSKIDHQGIHDPKCLSAIQSAVTAFIASVN